jgi:hypothetical protein
MKVTFFNCGLALGLFACANTALALVPNRVPTTVPALDSWGLVGLSALVVAATFIAMKRRKK